METEEAVNFCVKALSSGQRESFVHSQLVDRGIAAGEAERILQVALGQLRESQDEEEQKQKLPFRIAGVVLCLCGVGMLVYTFTIAGSGGLYLVPGGLIGYGAYMWATGTGKL